uniref:Acid phosphatase n=1 Tax=Oryza barthii TaxID=65489 RepID=A0A0D3G438_9ORYZ
MYCVEQACSAQARRPRLRRLAPPARARDSKATHAADFATVLSISFPFGRRGSDSPPQIRRGLFLKLEAAPSAPPVEMHLYSRDYKEFRIGREKAFSSEETLRLYQKPLQLGIKPLFLSDRTDDDQRELTTNNLLQQGYCNLGKLVLQPEGLETSTLAFKTCERQKLVNDGYIDDQWNYISSLIAEGCRLAAPLSSLTHCMTSCPLCCCVRAQPYDNRSFLQYVEQGSAPALAGTLRLYQRLLELGIKPVFLTVRTENQRAVTIRNLSQQGYSGWEKLVLQPTGGLSIEAFKSGERQKLVSDGYAIVGNIGDQWSDLLGPAAGARTFKLSNRMYYVDKLALLAGRRRRHC